MDKCVGWPFWTTVLAKDSQMGYSLPVMVMYAMHEKVKEDWRRMEVLPGGVEAIIS